MTLVPIILSLALIGLIVWVILQIPMPDVVRKVIIALTIVFLVLHLLQLLGVNTGLPALRLF